MAVNGKIREKLTRIMMRTEEIKEELARLELSEESEGMIVASCKNIEVSIKMINLALQLDMVRDI